MLGNNACYLLQKRPTNVVVFTFKGDHNHEIGSLSDFESLPVSKNTKKFIFQQLSEGFMCRDVRLSVQRKLTNAFQQFIRIDVNGSTNSNRIVHRDQILDAGDVYNQYRSIQEKSYKLAEDQKISIQLWLEGLTVDNNYLTFTGVHFKTNFTFGFLSPWQKNILIQSPYWCLDATHKTSNIDKCLLYTVVVRHPMTGTGCPVAFCFTTDHSTAPLLEFLTFLKNNGCSNVQKITIDVSNVELNAINAVFPQAQVQWCLFHVARAWMGKIKETVKTGISATNATTHKAIITSLKSMMWERNQAEFTVKLRDFIQEHLQYTELMTYLRRYYLGNDAFMHWTQPVINLQSSPTWKRTIMLKVGIIS